MGIRQMCEQIYYLPGNTLHMPSWASLIVRGGTERFTAPASSLDGIRIVIGCFIGEGVSDPEPILTPS